MSYGMHRNISPFGSECRNLIFHTASSVAGAISSSQMRRIVLAMPFQRVAAAFGHRELFNAREH